MGEQARHAHPPLPQAPEERQVPVIDWLNALGEGKHTVPLGVMRGSGMRSLLHTCRPFGALALPIIALNDEVVCMGNPTPEQAVSAIREKMD